MEARFVSVLAPNGIRAGLAGMRVFRGLWSRNPADVPGFRHVSFSMKLAKRDCVPLARLRERVGGEGNGHGKPALHYLGRRPAMIVSPPL